MHWRSSMSGVILYLRALRTSPNGDGPGCIGLFEMSGKLAIWCSKVISTVL